MALGKVYELPLSPDYVRHWGVVEAVRELLQNAIDSDAPMEYSIGADSLSIFSHGITLDPSTLVLGVTTKADDDRKIGSFGEGYKIALLVLTRNEKVVTVRNGSLVWQPEFRHSLSFNTRLLHITEHHGADAGGLLFHIGALTTDELQAILDSCLLMQPEIEDAIVVPQGRILPSRPGKLYVNGLFICDTELEYGYDVKPNFVRLERDRQTVDTWDLKTLTRDMWMTTGQHDRVAELIASEIPDVAYVEYGGAIEEVKEACYRLFKAKNPEGIAVRTQQEMEALIERGMTNTVYVGGGYYSALTSSRSYREVEAPKVEAPTPQAALIAFFEQYGKYMPRLPKVAMKKLIERSKDWRVK